LHDGFIARATELGFHSADFLHTSFRKTYGTTPLKWRAQARAAARGA